MSNPAHRLTRRLSQALQTVALGTVTAGVLTAVLNAPTGFAADTSLVSQEPATARTAAQSAAQSAAVGANNVYARTAFNATNTARRNNDRANLRGNACLRNAALRQARTMARTGRLAHQDLGRIQRDCKVGFVGENVAYGYANGRQLVFQGWMKSSGHRQNILSRNYRTMGLAAVKDGRGRWWSAQVFGRPS